MATNQWVIQAGSEYLYPAATAITAAAPTRKIRVAANMRLRSEKIKELAVSGGFLTDPLIGLSTAAIFLLILLDLFG